MNTTPLQAHRARESLAAARQAAAADQAAKLREIFKRCASCGAPVPNTPAEGEGLPCGH